MFHIWLILVDCLFMLVLCVLWSFLSYRLLGQATLYITYVNVNIALIPLPLFSADRGNTWWFFLRSATWFSISLVWTVCACDSSCSGPQDFRLSSSHRFSNHKHSSSQKEGAGNNFAFDVCIFFYQLVLSLCKLRILGKSPGGCCATILSLGLRPQNLVSVTKTETQSTGEPTSK